MALRLTGQRYNGLGRDPADLVDRNGAEGICTWLLACELEKQVSILAIVAVCEVPALRRLFAFSDCLLSALRRVDSYHTVRRGEKWRGVRNGHSRVTCMQPL
jgi:hypothetical protein